MTMASNNASERKIIAKLAAATRLARTEDRRTLTEKARAARRAQFEREAAEANPQLTGDALLRAADQLQRAHMLRMSLASRTGTERAPLQIREGAVMTAKHRTRKRDPIEQARRDSYFLSRALGDVQAAKRGRLGKRLVRRSLTRALFRGWQ